MRGWILFLALATLVLAPPGPWGSVHVSGADKQPAVDAATGDGCVAMRLERFDAADFLRAGRKSIDGWPALAAGAPGTTESAIIRRLPIAALLPMPTPTLQLQHVRLQP